MDTCIEARRTRRVEAGSCCEVLGLRCVEGDGVATDTATALYAANGDTATMTTAKASCSIPP